MVLKIVFLYVLFRNKYVEIIIKIKLTITIINNIQLYKKNWEFYYRKTKLFNVHKNG